MRERVCWTTICVYSFLIYLIFFDIGTAIAKNTQSPNPLEKPSIAIIADKSTLTKSTPDFKTDLTLTAGLRRDDLEWSIAGNGINVLSELSWSDVESYQISLHSRTQLEDRVYLRAHINYAWVIDGTIRDSDYGQNGEAAEWSRSISESTGDELWDITAGGGYSFFFLQKRLTVSPLLGISFHKQNLRIQNGRQVISETNPFGGSNPPGIGPLSDQLDSSYFARWTGPWLGCDLSYEPNTKLFRDHTMEFRFSFELHWAQYFGEGNWNLRGDLAHPRSFDHRADGFGISLTGQWLINMRDQWDIALTASHQDWSTESGEDRKFLASGGTASTRLNGVDWSSTSFMVGAVYHF